MPEKKIEKEGFGDVGARGNVVSLKPREKRISNRMEWSTMSRTAEQSERMINKKRSFDLMKMKLSGD